MRFTPQEIAETIRMVSTQNFDIRTITLGISIRDCARTTASAAAQAIYDKICREAQNLVSVAEELESEYGIPIINKRISTTPVSLIADPCHHDDVVVIAQAMDKAAEQVGVNFIGGFSALVHKGFSSGDIAVIKAIPQSLAQTERVCASVNVANTRAGINMDAVLTMGHIIKETANLTAERGGLGCAKLVVFANMPEDNPFMAGAMHGVGEGESVINVGISGPGVILEAIKNQPDLSLGQLAEIIKRTAFKITRAGELIGREASRRLGVEYGVVDLALAPTPAVGDSIADILKAIGLTQVGAPGTTAALMMLIDAVKKGGAMASTYVGGLSGAFIPVSEDAGMIQAVAEGHLSLEKLEAMTAVCSVGLDMIAIPGDTSAETIAGIIADEIAIGVVNKKTTAVRVIPAPGKQVGDSVEFGGLLGRAPIMPVNPNSCETFVTRGGRIPAPIHSLTN